MQITTKNDKIAKIFKTMTQIDDTTIIFTIIAFSSQFHQPHHQDGMVLQVFIF